MIARSIMFDRYYGKFTSEEQFFTTLENMEYRVGKTEDSVYYIYDNCYNLADKIVLILEVI